MVCLAAARDFKLIQLVTPTTPAVAFELLDRRAQPGEMAGRMAAEKGKAVNTMPLDLSGHPALTVPCGTGEHDLPVGLQLIGPHFAETMLLNAAHAYQRETDWHRKVPEAVA